MPDLFFFLSFIYFHRRVNRFDKYLTIVIIIVSMNKFNTNETIFKCMLKSYINSKESYAINTTARVGRISDNPSFSVKINL